MFTIEDTVYDKLIPNKTDSGLPQIHISVDNVMKKLQKLKMGFTPGGLKELIEVISPPLTILFNASLELGTLPYEWRKGNIIATYKKGSRQVCRNDRPVSLTCIAFKVLESVLREQLIDYLKKNKLFSNKHFGFLGGHSITLQLITVLHDWTDILHSIDGAVLKWISTFLSIRAQRVIVNGQDSVWQVGFLRELY